MEETFAAQFESLFILFGMLLVPALVILGVLVYLRKRRSSFRHKSRRSSHSRRST